MSTLICIPWGQICRKGWNQKTLLWLLDHKSNGCLRLSEVLQPDSFPLGSFESLIWLHILTNRYSRTIKRMTYCKFIECFQREFAECEILSAQKFSSTTYRAETHFPFKLKTLGTREVERKKEKSLGRKIRYTLWTLGEVATDANSERTFIWSWPNSSPTFSYITYVFNQKCLQEVDAACKSTNF